MDGKNIFATISYVATKITEAITGHKNDEQAHPSLTNQIGVLEGRVEWKPNDWKDATAKPKDYPQTQTTLFFSSNFDGITNVVVEVKNFNGALAAQYISGFDGTPLKYRLGKTIDLWGEWKEAATIDATVQRQVGSKYTFNTADTIFTYPTGSIRFTDYLGDSYMQCKATENDNGTLNITGWAGKPLSRLNFNVSADNAQINGKKIATADKIDILKPVLLASGVFKTGDVITLTKPLGNFSKLVFTTGDAGLSLNTNTIVGYSYPSPLGTTGAVYMGADSFGSWTLTPNADGTQLTVTQHGKYLRRIYGFVEGV